MTNTPSFADLNLSPNILEALEKKGFTKPSPIQEQVIPLLLNSKSHVIAQAQTGTGKTAAFGIPIIERINENENRLQAIVLTPTRELCTQVCTELNSLRNNKKINIVPIYGGQSIELQFNKLKKNPHIIVGTPGRVIDHLKRGSFKLNAIDFLILDEADEMLSMGFQPDIELIMSYSKESNPQTLLFSATFPSSIKRLINKYLTSYEQVSVKAEEMTTSLIEQVYYEVSYKNKFQALCRLVDINPRFYGIIFCLTKVDVQDIAQKLAEKGYSVGELHGDLSQNQREQTLKKFKQGIITIMVATDVAARGIDVQNLTHVINYALPQDPEAYVHRIGRTGRAGSEGIAISLVGRNEYSQLLLIQRITGATIVKKKLPSATELVTLKTEQLLREIETSISGESTYHDIYKELAVSLLSNDADPTSVLAYVLSHFLKENLVVHTYDDISEESMGGGGSYNSEETRIFIAMGRKTGATPQKIIDLLKSKADVSSKDINKITIMDDFSFATLPTAHAHMLVKSEKKGAGGGRSLISLAKGGQGEGGSKGGYSSRGSYGGGFKGKSSYGSGSGSYKGNGSGGSSRYKK